MAKTIKFKSIPENWRKEYLNLKCNTIRKFDNDTDIRLQILNAFINGIWTLINIEIENTETHEIFTRRITDVTKWEDYYIISWSPFFTQS